MSLKCFSHHQGSAGIATQKGASPVLSLWESNICMSLFICMSIRIENLLSRHLCAQKTYLWSGPKNNENQIEGFLTCLNSVRHLLACRYAIITFFFEALGTSTMWHSGTFLPRFSAGGIGLTVELVLEYADVLDIEHWQVLQQVGYLRNRLGVPEELLGTTIGGTNALMIKSARQWLLQCEKKH